MKFLSALSLIVTLCFCSSNKTLLTIPNNQSLELDYPDYKLFQARLTNRSSKGFKVAVLSKVSQKQIRGFGLEGRAKADVMVEAANKLVLINQNNSSIRVTLKVNPTPESTLEPNAKTVSFTLKNNSSEVIPLFIPGVMNPNLTPFSKSLVTLELEQEIFFRIKGKKYRLLKVSEAITAGAEIDIAELLEKRKQELDLN